MIEYEEEWVWSVIFMLDGWNLGTCTVRSILYTMPAVFIAVAIQYMDEFRPGLREDLGFSEMAQSQLWVATAAGLSTLIFFRTGRAYSRFWEGTGLLHQMRGEWFDTVSNCVSFSIPAKDTRPQEVMAFRHTLVRLMSLCHGSALEEISGNSIEVESIDTFGLNEATLRYLQECHHVHNFNKVEVMLHLIQSLITMALHEDVIRVPAPVCSRVYQTISRGFVNLLNAKKIQDTRFPFPLAQLIYLMLLACYAVVPFLITSIVDSKVLTALMTFLPLFTLFNLNFISIELEDPFGTDDNDLPLQNFQTEMNNCLMMLLHPRTDLRAGISHKCQTDFFKLNSEVRTCRSDVSERSSKRLDEFDITKRRGSQGSGDVLLSEGVDPYDEEDFEDDIMFPGPALSTTGPTPGPAAQLAQAKAAPASASAEAESGSLVEEKGKKNVKISSEPPELSEVDIDQHNERPPDKSSPGNRKGQQPAAPNVRDPSLVKPKAAPPELLETQKVHPDIVNSPRDPTAYSQQPWGAYADKGADLMNFAGLRDPTNPFPQLALNMDHLVMTLQRWTRHVEAEVENLLTNSQDLKEALRKMASGLPAMLNNPISNQQLQLVMSQTSTEVSMTMQPVGMRQPVSPVDSSVLYSV